MNSLATLRNFVLALVAFLAFASAAAFAKDDLKGATDHPLFPTRMPGYYISGSKVADFAAYKFPTRPPTIVEGKHFSLHYTINDPKQHPGGLAIRRNYENAIKAAGGEVLVSDDKQVVMKANRGSVETWAMVRASNSTSSRIYFLDIVEVKALRQVVTADAIGNALDKDGFIALDIRFATGKATLLPESGPVVAEIAALLKRRPKLKVGIEGHTDNTGTPETNKTLSLARAETVVLALADVGIAKDRMIPAGFGQDKPVADNRSEEGRAKNRRVEIVKK